MPPWDLVDPAHPERKLWADRAMVLRHARAEVSAKGGTLLESVKRAAGLKR